MEGLDNRELFVLLYDGAGAAGSGKGQHGHMLGWTARGIYARKDCTFAIGGRHKTPPDQGG